MAIKRNRSSSPSGGTSKAKKITKKPAKAHGKEPDQIDSVLAALKEVGAPEDVQKMMTRAGKIALSAYADERHPLQEKIVSMIAELFQESLARLEEKKAAAEAKVASFDEEQLQKRIPEHAHVRAQCKGDVATKEARLIEAEIELQKATANHKAAVKEQKGADVEYTDITVQMEIFDDLMKRFETMKANSEGNTKFAASRLAKELQAIGVDPSLLGTLQVVLTKPGALRGEFDDVTFDNFVAEMKTKRKDVEFRIAELEPAKQLRDSKMAAAKDVLDAATANFADAKASLQVAESSVQVGEQQLHDASNDLKYFDKNLKLAEAALTRAQEDVVKFTNGPLHDFNELAARNKPAPTAEEE